LGIEMRPAMKPNITMFFPAYNEVENIPRLLTSALRVLKKHAARYEVLVVVFEGSTDGTIPLVRKWERKNTRIRLIIQPRNLKGVGYAKKMAFEEAKYPNIFYTDADNQFNIEEFERFVPFIEKYDIIAGFRIKRCDPLTRRAISWVYNLMMSILFNTRERDLDCAFRLVNKRVIDTLPLKCRTGLATMEILARARKHGFRIKEVGVHHYPRRFGVTVFEGGFLNLPRPSVIMEILKETWMLYKELYLSPKK
jgi:glycosyltransferase involved in cell wall biosynthesis